MPCATCIPAQRARFPSLLQCTVCVPLLVAALDADLMCPPRMTADANTVCARAQYHYDPQVRMGLSLSETGESEEEEFDLDAFKKGFLPLHERMMGSMYFS